MGIICGKAAPEAICIVSQKSFLLHFANIFLQFNFLDFLFQLSTAAGTVSGPAITNWAVYFSFQYKAMLLLDIV